MKVYLKLFLAAVIPYTLALSWLLHNNTLAMIVGVVFGLLISSVFGTLQVRSMQGKKRDDGSYAVHQTREVEIDLSFDEASVLARASLRDIHGLKILRESGLTVTPEEAYGTIDARTGLNWETAGEKIGLRITRVDDNTSRIRIESRPRLSTTLIDYGRNLHNVNMISRYLRGQTAADHLRLEETYPHLALDEDEGEKEKNKEKNKEKEKPRERRRSRVAEILRLQVPDNVSTFYEYEGETEKEKNEDKPKRRLSHLTHR
jgi:hypothetical protein